MPLRMPGSGSPGSVASKPASRLGDAASVEELPAAPPVPVLGGNCRKSPVGSISPTQLAVRRTATEMYPRARIENRTRSVARLALATSCGPGSQGLHGAAPSNQLVEHGVGQRLVACVGF